MRKKATDKQKEYLKSLGAKFKPSLTKQGASRRIDRILAAKTRLTIKTEALDAELHSRIERDQS